jgi:pimeloyl-ACP methyl ester carboxylesterase
MTPLTLNSFLYVFLFVFALTRDQRFSAVEFIHLLAAVLRGGFYDPSKLPRDLVDEFYRTGLRDGYRAAEYSMFKNWQTWVDARKLYAQITIPVTLVYSRYDWSRPSERERNKQAIRNSELILLEEAGHFSTLENPTEVANIILSQRTQSGYEEMANG